MKYQISDSWREIRIEYSTGNCDFANICFFSFYITNNEADINCITTQHVIASGAHVSIHVQSGRDEVIGLFVSNSTLKACPSNIVTTNIA